jgi:hypothetical protein
MRVFVRDVRMENRQGLMHEAPPIAKRSVAMGVSLWMRAFIYGILFGRLGGFFYEIRVIS